MIESAQDDDRWHHAKCRLRLRIDGWPYGKATKVALSAFMLMSCLFGMGPTICLAENEPHRADEPFASIDGEPIFLGELNLVLAERLGVRDGKNATIAVRQAAAAILVRRHLAMKTLRTKAGAELDAIIRKESDRFSAELRRRGSSLSKYAEARSADEPSVLSDLAWQTAWRQYLKSRLSDENLRKFYSQRSHGYDDSRWNVSHLFVPAPETNTVTIPVTKNGSEDNSESQPAISQRVKKLASELRDSPSKEESFVTAAREHSQAGSAAEGGKLGWVGNDGDLPNAVMKALRSSKTGEVIGPIQSPIGFHLLLVHDYEQGKKSFDELADHSQLRRDAADTLFDSLISENKNPKLVWHLEQFQPPIPLP